MMKTPGSCRISPTGRPTEWPWTMAVTALRATDGDKSPNGVAVFRPKFRYSCRPGSQIIGQETPFFSIKFFVSSGLPIPTNTSWHPDFSSCGSFERNCATCCRQKAQPRWRRKIRTNGWSRHISLRSRVVPSAKLTLLSTACSFLASMSILPWLSRSWITELQEKECCLSELNPEKSGRHLPCLDRILAEMAIRPPFSCTQKPFILLFHLLMKSTGSPASFPLQAATAFLCALA